MLNEKNPKTRSFHYKLLSLEDRILGHAFPGMRRAKQITIYHCGPAVLESLFSFLGVKVSQRSLVRSLRLQRKIVLYGLTIKELARAVRIAGKGNYSFWKKTNAKLSDIDKIVNKYKFPVGVEWQGIFYEYEDEDSGHYSIVTRFSFPKGTLRIADPFHAFSRVDRKLEIRDFQKRWWDQNEIAVSGTSKRRKIKDNRALFVVTPASEKWPLKIGLKKYY